MAFSYPWNNIPTVTGPAVDEAKVIAVENSVQDHKKDLNLINPKDNPEILKEAGGTALMSDDRLIGRTQVLLNAHPSSYSDAAKDAATLQGMNDGIQRTDRSRQAFQEGADAAGATVVVRKAERAQFAYNINARIEKEVADLRAAGQPIPSDLGAVYDGLQGELQRIAQGRSAAVNSGIKGRAADSAQAADDAKTQQMEALIAALQGEVSRLTALTQLQAPAASPPSSAPPPTTPVTTKSTRKTPR